eukprot:scaffold224014_cov55-Attheya_sp.AAC.2
MCYDGVESLTFVFFSMLAISIGGVIMLTLRMAWYEVEETADSINHKALKFEKELTSDKGKDTADNDQDRETDDEDSVALFNFCSPSMNREEEESTRYSKGDSEISRRFSIFGSEDYSDYQEDSLESTSLDNSKSMLGKMQCIPEDFLAGSESFTTLDESTIDSRRKKVNPWSKNKKDLTGDSETASESGLNIRHFASAVDSVSAFKGKKNQNVNYDSETVPTSSILKKVSSFSFVAGASAADHLLSKAKDQQLQETHDTRDDTNTLSSADFIYSHDALASPSNVSNDPTTRSAAEINV